MPMDPPMRDAPSASTAEVVYQLARHMASRAAAALAMAGQPYRVEVRPDEAYGELVRILQSWVEQHVDLPETDRSK
jgi:hypothetical protein